MAFGCLALSCGLAGGLVWQSARGTITPWVVQVDRLGQAQVGRACERRLSADRPGDRLASRPVHRGRPLHPDRPGRAPSGLAAGLRLHQPDRRSGAERLRPHRRPLRQARPRAGLGGCLQRHPRFARDSFRVALERAPLQGRRACRDPALERHRHRHAPGSRTIRTACVEIRSGSTSPPWLGRRSSADARSSAPLRLQPHPFSPLALMRRSRPRSPTTTRRSGRRSAKPIRSQQRPSRSKLLEVPRPLPLPGQLKPLPAKKAELAEAADPRRRVASANASARVQPSRDGYLNAVQVYPSTEGALYQVYASPGEITDIALQPGEALAGSGPIAAGDTVRWIIGETESGAGRDPAHPRAPETHARRSLHQSRDRHRSADLSPGTPGHACDLHGLGLLALSGGRVARGEAEQRGGRRPARPWTRAWTWRS